MRLIATRKYLSLPNQIAIFRGQIWRSPDKYAMNNYIAVVRVGRQSIKTLIHAESAAHARALLQHHFGNTNIAAGPTPVSRFPAHFVTVDQLVEQATTPEQQRIATLQSAKDRAADALAAERLRIRTVKAQRALTAARRSTPIQRTQQRKRPQ